MTQPNQLIRFGVFEVNPRSGELRKKGTRVKLQDQPLQILLAVLEKPGEMVTREELRAKLWPADTFVDFDHGLNAAVKRLRDALGDTAENPRYIETLPRHGYRFIAATVPEEIPAQQKKSLLERWHWLIGTAAVLLIAIVLFALDAGGLRSKILFRSTAPPQIRSLAVLPLTNLSGDPEQEYFADGMTDELIGELSRIGSLRVISRTSAMQYKGEKKKPLAQIGRELNADAVMEGSVLRSGNRVRIAAHMIYAPTDQSLLTETYESDLSDVLKLQREVAEAMAQKVKLKLTSGEKARLHDAPEVNPQAWHRTLATHLPANGSLVAPHLPRRKASAILRFSSKARLGTYIVDMTGGDAKFVKEGSQSSAWSLDGKSLLINVPLPGKKTWDLDSVELATFDIESGKISTIPNSHRKSGAFQPTPQMIVAAGEQDKLYWFDRTTAKWSLLADGPIQNYMISPDSKYLYFVRETPENPQAMRVRFADRRIEVVASLKGVRRVADPEIGGQSWVGVAPDGSLLLTRDTGAQEVYALNVRWP
jgi:TolB-like protein/DNA-binding winged helix-turn-helix (wHTH) protein